MSSLRRGLAMTLVLSPVLSRQANRNSHPCDTIRCQIPQLCQRVAQQMLWSMTSRPNTTTATPLAMKTRQSQMTQRKPQHEMPTMFARAVAVAWIQVYTVARQLRARLLPQPETAATIDDPPPTLPRAILRDMDVLGKGRPGTSSRLTLVSE